MVHNLVVHNFVVHNFVVHNFVECGSGAGNVPETGTSSALDWVRALNN